MFGLIENLRQKSEGYRKGVAFGVSFLVTLMIFGVWMTVLYPNVISPTKGGIVAEREQAPKSGSSDFKKNMAQTFGALEVQWDTIKEYFKTTKYEAQAVLEVAVPERNQAKVEVQNRATQSPDSATGEERSVVY